jgi:RNA polymerase sigma-70 factor, ECF subfamily
VQTLMKMLAPDATWIVDGGGKVSAARRLVVGAAKVAAAIAGLVRKGLPDMRVEMATCNSAPAAPDRSRRG